MYLEIKRSEQAPQNAGLAGGRIQFNKTKIGPNNGTGLPIRFLPFSVKMVREALSKARNELN